MLCEHREAARIVGWMCMANVGLPIGYGRLFGGSNEIATEATATNATRPAGPAWVQAAPAMRM